MKTITRLTGTVQENAPWNDPRGNISALLDEPQPGYLRTIHLTGAGITVRSGSVCVGIPLDALLKLVEDCEPGLVAPTAEEKIIVSASTLAKKLASPNSKLPSATSN